MSTQVISDTEAATQPTALQAKSGLAMPITRIKTDVKRLSGCDQMATDATVALAAVMEYFTEEVSRRAHASRRKGHTSIACEVVEEVVTAEPDFATLLGDNPVFATRVKKVKAKKEVDPDAPPKEPKTKREKKVKAEGEEGAPKTKRVKKEKVVKTEEVSSNEDE